MPPAGPNDDFDPLRHRREIELMEQRFRERSQQAGDDEAQPASGTNTNTSEADERVSDEMRDFFCDSTQRLETLVPQLQRQQTHDELVETTGEILRGVESVFGTDPELPVPTPEPSVPDPPGFDPQAFGTPDSFNQFVPPAPPASSAPPGFGEPPPAPEAGGEALPDFLSSDPFAQPEPSPPPAQPAPPPPAPRQQPAFGADPGFGGDAGIGGDPGIGGDTGYAPSYGGAPPPPDPFAPPPAPPPGVQAARPPDHQQAGQQFEAPPPAAFAPPPQGDPYAAAPYAAPEPRPKKKKGKLDLKTALARLKSGKPMNLPKDQRKPETEELGPQPAAPHSPAGPPYGGQEGRLPPIAGAYQQAAPPPGMAPLPSQTTHASQPRSPEEERARLEEIQRRMRTEGPGWDALQQAGAELPPGSSHPGAGLAGSGQEVYMPAPVGGGPLMQPPPAFETSLGDEYAAGFDEVFNELEELVRGSLGEPAPATLDWLATSEIVDGEEIEAVVASERAAGDSAEWSQPPAADASEPVNVGKLGGEDGAADDGLSQEAMLSELKRLRELEDSLLERGLVTPEDPARNS